MRWRVRILVLVAPCGTGGPQAGDDRAPTPGPPAPPATPAASADDRPECHVATTYVYVITEDSHLHRFEPDKLLFTEIGHVMCPTAETPFSMAVDRHGRAWVNYHKGGL